MLLFDFLKLTDPTIDAENCKIHLAVWNGDENPLEVFLEGRFQEWQAWQTKRNFDRKFIVSLIQQPSTSVGKWLLAGVYESVECKYIEEGGDYYYKTVELEHFKSVAGRIVVDFQRSGRQSYLLAENWEKSLLVSEMKPEKMVVEDFVGFNRTMLSYQRLKTVIDQGVDSWRSALSSVSGVYLITDTKTGKLYVGSATGEGGIWQRWCDYAYSGQRL